MIFTKFLDIPRKCNVIGNNPRYTSNLESKLWLCPLISLAVYTMRVKERHLKIVKPSKEIKINPLILTVNEVIDHTTYFQPLCFCLFLLLATWIDIHSESRIMNSRQASRGKMHRSSIQTRISFPRDSAFCWSLSQICPRRRIYHRAPRSNSNRKTDWNKEIFKWNLCLESREMVTLVESQSERERGWFLNESYSTHENRLWLYAFESSVRPDSANWVLESQDVRQVRRLLLVIPDSNFEFSSECPRARTQFAQRLKKKEKWCGEKEEDWMMGFLMTVVGLLEVEPWIGRRESRKTHKTVRRNLRVKYVNWEFHGQSRLSFYSFF